MELDGLIVVLFRRSSVASLFFQSAALLLSVAFFYATFTGVF